MSGWLGTLKRQPIASFWGPVGIAAGVICILNVYNITAESMQFEPATGLTNLIAGMVLVILGVFLSLLANGG